MVATKAESGERRAEGQDRNASIATQRDRRRGSRGHQTLVMGGYLVFAAGTQPLEELPPPTHAAILMTLLGILLLGLFLVVAILLGGNWVRKLGKHHRGPSVPPDVAPLRPWATSDTPPVGSNRSSVYVNARKNRPKENIDHHMPSANQETKITDETQGN